MSDLLLAPAHSAPSIYVASICSFAPLFVRAFVNTGRFFPLTWFTAVSAAVDSRDGDDGLVLLEMHVIRVSVLRRSHALAVNRGVGLVASASDPIPRTNNATEHQFKAG